MTELSCFIQRCREWKTVDDLKRLKAEFYDFDGNGCGGNLHVVLDDGNLEDRSVQSCIDSAVADKDEAGTELGLALKRATLFQRGVLYGFPLYGSHLPRFWNVPKNLHYPKSDAVEYFQSLAVIMARLEDEQKAAEALDALYLVFRTYLKLQTW